MKRLLMSPALLAAVLGGSLAAVEPGDTAPSDIGPGDIAPVDFDRDVRPLLADRCFLCHGPDVSTREAQLRLDTRAGLLEPRRDGPGVIVVGDPDASALVARILAEDPERRMPPTDSGKRLDDAERAVLVRWVAEGAQWVDHWAFTPPGDSAPQPPLLSEGLSKESASVRNDIDRFVLAVLEQRGLEPTPEADRRTLLRRVSLDLTGLPPSRAELAVILADQEAKPYERAVDRLLASPPYAEHMARQWLDVARYGDTHGLHLDNYREMWPYRDWVVDAFAANMPYDRFVIEQLAGDLLPDATLGNRVASGFNRCHVTTNEGGSITEEVRVRNVVDRVNTCGTAFLGLTLGCAQCHDHKFDPISQRDYYGFYAFFNNLDGKAMDDNAAAPAPVVRVPSSQQTARLEELDAQRSATEAEAWSRLAEIDYTEPELVLQEDPERIETLWLDDSFPEGAVVEDAARVWVGSPAAVVRAGELSLRFATVGQQQWFFRNAARKLRIGAGDKLFAWVYLDPEDPPEEILFQFNSDGDAAWIHGAFWGEDLIPYGQEDSSQRRNIGPLPEPGGWAKLEVDAVAIGLRPGMVVHGLAVTQASGRSWMDGLGIVSATTQQPADVLVVEDELPEGASPRGDGEIWQWIGADEGPVHGGERAWRRSGGNDLNQDIVTDMPALRIQRGDRLFAYAWLDPDNPPRSVQLQFNDGSWEHRVRWGEPAHGSGREGGADHRGGDLPPLGTWVRLEVDASEVDLAPGGVVRGWAFTQVGGTVYWDDAGVNTWAPHDERTAVSLALWETYAVHDDSLPEETRAALAIAPADRTDEQSRRVHDHYVRFVFADTRAVFDPYDERLATLRTEREEVEGAIPTTLVMKELAEPRAAFVLERGDYDKPGEAVERRTPDWLPPMGDDLPHDRLGLARWLVDPGHPLTARVEVNRLWQQLFGAGLVKTSEDFGNQGQRPSHPGLLDWLATRFVEDGWDVKRTLRRMVTSAAYRRSSVASPGLREADPDNRLLARGPRFRLDAEVLRDQALALSGLLVEQRGGPGVKPPQPAGVWKSVAYVGSNTQVFTADTEPDKVHRRSLYTFWKRTSPPPQMAILDAPSREECRVRRERTNTPLQALLLMNDPQYVQAARALAARTLDEGGATAEQRVRFLFETCTARVPQAADMADMLELLEAQRAELAGDPEAARRLAAAPSESAPPPRTMELAAWTLLANLVLNLDEVVNRE